LDRRKVPVKRAEKVTLASHHQEESRGQALMGRVMGAPSANLAKGRPIWTAHEAFTDPRGLGKRLSNEAHGFTGC
jgi:hypothetical protein